MPNLKAQADERLDQALQTAGLADPREAGRAQLRRLKETAPAAFAEAVEYYESTLLPRIAEQGHDPITEWIDYGLLLLRLQGLGGRVFQIDRTGRARTCEPPHGPDDPILHLPDDPREAATLVMAPLELSAAQRASIDLLVEGRTELA